MIYWELFSTFFRIGAFSFGGGYAMIPLFEKEVAVIHGWLPMDGMLDMIAISQMTPGPLAINLATFVGYRVSGFWGALVSTLGIVTPSAIIIIMLARFFLKFQERPEIQGIMEGIRPIAVALIVVAAISVARTSLLEWKNFVVLGFVLLGVFRFDLHPIILILGSGIVGLLLY